MSVSINRDKTVKWIYSVSSEGWFRSNDIRFWYPNRVVWHPGCGSSYSSGSGLFRFCGSCSVRNSAPIFSVIAGQNRCHLCPSYWPVRFPSAVSIACHQFGIHCPLNTRQMWVTFRHISKPVLNEQACLRHHSKGSQTSQQGCQDNGCQFCFHSIVSILLENRPGNHHPLPVHHQQDRQVWHLPVVVASIVKETARRQTYRGGKKFNSKSTGRRGQWTLGWCCKPTRPPRGFWS